MKAEPCIALVGNPNSGKTTLFNRLTGASQHVGNWPGVAVEKKEGTLEYEGVLYRVVDLPGIYSLGAFSEDEIVARDYILSDDADVIINVIEASNLERNLYLTTQLLEMGRKVVIALNMVDEAERKQIRFDLAKLSALTGTPVVKTVALRGEGIEELIRAAIDTMGKRDPFFPSLPYKPAVAHHIDHMEELLADIPLPYPVRWTAIKMVEGDSHVLDKLQTLSLPDSLMEGIEEFFQYHSRDSFELDIIDSRYSFAHQVAGQSVIRPEE
ncbi:MAG: GTP-binding protein, partial [Clostridiaceae bacterium]|nr:GTP-binding protein [Clostridiaceae bacterium]